jgi:excisionase family DNA binding protein
MGQYASPKHDDPEGLEPRLLTYREAVAYLHISERTLWSMQKYGEIATVRLRQSVRFDRQELDRWIDAQQRQ